MTSRPPLVAVVIPCYRVAEQVLAVIAAVPPVVSRIYCVDDSCPQHSGTVIEQGCADPRVTVLRHSANAGVGGAMITGYRQALADRCDVIVKLDGDGQMNPALIPVLIRPLLNGSADYTKGNRFWNLADVRTMPRVRLVGNALLSFFTKFSSGYWTVFDPTNGYTAIHGAVLRRLPLAAVSRRFFFESDLLFHLGMVRAVVVDIPMTAVYQDESSNLRIGRIIGPFLLGNLGNFAKRLVYSYFLRDFSAASVELVLGTLLLMFGVGFGAINWMAGNVSHIPATAGTVMVGALPIIIGFNLLLSFLNFDALSVPQRPIHPDLIENGEDAAKQEETRTNKNK